MALLCSGWKYYCWAVSVKYDAKLSRCCHHVMFLVWGYVGGMQPCCAGVCVDARLFAAMRGDNVCWRCGENKMLLQIVKCWLKRKLGCFVDALKGKVLCSSPLLKTFLFCSRLTCSSVNPSLMKFLNSLRKYIRLLEEVIFFINKCLHSTF